MSDEFDDILNQAEALTKKEFDARISSLTRLKDSDISALFPSKPDKEKLVQLIRIVQGATTDNQKKKQLLDNIETLAGTVIRLLGHLV